MAPSPLFIAVILVLISPLALQDDIFPLPKTSVFAHQVTQQKPQKSVPPSQINRQNQKVDFDKFFQRKPYKKKSPVKKNVYTYKDEDGIFRTVVTTEKINSNMSQGKRVYSGSSAQGNLLSKNLNDRSWHNKETKLNRQGNTFLIPAIIGNRGKEIHVNLVVDTGCDTTLIHYDKLAKVSPRILKDVRMRVADGRIVNGKSAKVSYMKVGPIRETNFEINTHRVSGSNSSYSGLLGMNFFRDHPFRIDANRSMLVWK
jgi:hypothetical protein